MAIAERQRPKSGNQKAAIKRQRLGFKGQTAKASRNHRGVCACGFRARRSFFRSESKAPKTAPSHGFRSFAAIKPGARKAAIAARAACGLSEAAPQSPSPSQRGQTAARPNDDTAKQRQLNGSRPKSGNQTAAVGLQRPKTQEPDATIAVFALVDSAPAAHFSGANPRPRKRLHRTVLGALLLSNQERKKPPSQPVRLAALRKLRRKAQASAAKRRHGQTATAERQQQKSGNQTAAVEPQRPKTQKPDATIAALSRLWIPRPPLIFQEPIQGPENGPIARFDGLGCYQIRSE